MTYNNKKDNIEMDDMNIKSRLNASLDLSGISVSEDLINRTLAAISKQTIEQENEVQDKNEQEKILQDRTESGKAVISNAGQDKPEQTEADSKTSLDGQQKKIISWNRYIRTFAGVAAAAIVVVAGYGLISSGLFAGYKSAERSTDSSVAYDMADQATDTTGTTAATNAEESMSAEQSSPTEDSASTEESLTFSTTAIEDGAVEEEAPASIVGGALYKNAEGTEVLTFRDIFVSDPGAAKSLTITDHVNQISVTLTLPEDITAFYEVMDQYQFTYGTEASVEDGVTLEIEDTEGMIDTMNISEHITVTYEDADTSSQVVYDAVDPEGFQQSLQELITKYR